MAEQEGGEDSNALRRRLQEAEATLAAIRAGDVDALVVDGPAGQQVYTLESPDQPFRVFVDQMQEGAITLDAQGAVLYCNRFFADMVGCPVAQLRGNLMEHFIAPQDRARFREMLCTAARQSARGEFRLKGLRDRILPVRLAFNRLPAEDLAMYGVVLTDLSERERSRRLEAAVRERRRAARALERLAYRDPLTGISNRRYLERFARREWRREARSRRCVALVMADVDHFKAYNDQMGHPKGDECLQAVARALCKVLHRPADMLVRYGGEEFAALLPETSTGAAVLLAERMREAVEELRLPHPGSPFGQVTVSAGVAARYPHKCAFEELVQAADQALYHAKGDGRNRVASLDS